MSIHAGHRQRLRQRFKEMGLKGFADHEILELLLFYCISRRDTNAIAHKLIDRFGTFSQVLEAPVSELKKVEGIGEHTALFLSMLPEVMGRYWEKRLPQNEALTKISDYGRYIVPKFVSPRNEEVYLLCLDAKCMVLSCRKVGEGGINATSISIRKIVEVALMENATSVVLAHNHPSGIALPSHEDIVTTKAVATALRMVDVILSDHIIVADNDYVSLVESKLYDPDWVC